jgi:hypothetical protein
MLQGGLLEKFLPHAKWIKIVELAAIDSEEHGNYEDAIKLYDLAQVLILSHSHSSSLSLFILSILHSSLKRCPIFFYICVYTCI